MKNDLVPLRRILLTAALAACACALPVSPAAAAPPTGHLTALEPLSFAPTSVGSPNLQQLALKNASEAGLNVNAIQVEGVDPGDFGIEGTNCVGFIGPGMGCTLTVRFSPTASGSREALLRVSTNGSPSDYLSELSGEGVAPSLIFEPSEYDFGLVEQHGGTPRTNFVVRNAGVASVQLGNAEITGSGANEFFVSGNSCGGANLSPGATCAVEVQFNANEEGSFAAAVSINAGGTTFTAPLTARAEHPKVTASPSPVAFGPTPVGSRQVREVTFTNTGNLPVAFFISLVSGGDVSSFHLISENCTSNVFAGAPRVFEAGESCVAKIAFEPEEVGAKTGIFSLFGGGEGALQTSLEGTGVAAPPTPPVAKPADASMSAAPAAPRDRVVLSLVESPRLGGGRVTVGSALCASSQPCTVRLDGLVYGRLATASGSRPGIHGIGVTRMRLAPGAQASIVAGLPRAARGSRASVGLRISLHWRTGEERGTASRGFPPGES